MFSFDHVFKSCKPETRKCGTRSNQFSVCRNIEDKCDDFSCFKLNKIGVNYPNITIHVLRHSLKKKNRHSVSSDWCNFVNHKSNTSVR